MEWDTFVDDAKDMGTSIFDNFSSAFNTAMGKLLFTVVTMMTLDHHSLHFSTYRPFSIHQPNLMTSQCDYCLRYSPTFDQIASQEEIVHQTNIGLLVMVAMKTNVDHHPFVLAAVRIGVTRY